MPENGRDEKIRATVLAKLHRDGKYCPRGIEVANAASLGIASHNRGRAKELITEMAQDDSYPLTWKQVGEAVCLKQDSASWVASSIRRHADDDAVPWDIRDL